MMPHNTRCSWRPGLLAAALLAAALPALPAARALAAGESAPGSSPGEQVLARAGEYALTRAALQRQLVRYFAGTAREALLDRALVTQEAARLKVEVGEAELDARVAELKRRAGGDFAGLLRAEGLEEDAWREAVRFNLLAEKVSARKWPVRESDLVRYRLRYARLQTQKVAADFIREARSANFETLVLRDSEDKENGGLIQPEKFLKVDQPKWFRLAETSNLRPGQVSPRPIQEGGFWLVLRLEGRYGPETLSPQEREAAIRKVAAFRLQGLLPSLRRRYRAESGAHRLDLAELEQHPHRPAATVVSQAGSITVTLGELWDYLYRYAGRAALEQLIERAIITQEAARLEVTVPPAMLESRIAEARRAAGPLFAQTLQRDGISEEAWRERVRFTLLAERVVNTRWPAPDTELVRLTARYIAFPREGAARQAATALEEGAAFERVAQLAAAAGATVGLVQPREFLRADNPTIYQALVAAGVQPGQVVPQPVQVGRRWMLLRLEARKEPETLTPAEREEAARRINAPRAAQLLDAVRRGYKVEYVVPPHTLAGSSG